MSWDHIQGNWKRCCGILRVKWGSWIHNDAQIRRGKREQLLGTIQCRYRASGIHVEVQVDNFLRALGPTVLETSPAHQDREHRGDKP
jgi:uncharacterized protein YjbJ (UPF0337 family)